MNDDKARQHGMIAIIAFNLAVIFCMVVFAWLRGGMTYLHLMDFVGAVVISTIVAAAALGVASVVDG